MDTSDPAALFLPSLDRARAAGLDLPPGEPGSQRRIAALVVIGTLLRRESWDEEMELGGQIFASLQMGDPPIPHIFIEQSFQRLEKVIATHPCRMCNVHPGYSACRAYAWPVLWLHYHAHDIAIFTGRDGALHAHAGAPTP